MRVERLLWTARSGLAVGRAEGCSLHESERNNRPLWDSCPRTLRGSCPWPMGQQVFSKDLCRDPEHRALAPGEQGGSPSNAGLVVLSRDLEVRMRVPALPEGGWPGPFWGAWWRTGGRPRSRGLGRPPLFRGPTTAVPLDEAQRTGRSECWISMNAKLHML